MINTFHIIVSLHPIGGAELMLKRLLLECSHDDNYKQTVLTLKGPGVIDDDLRAKGVDVINLNMVRSFKSSLGGMYKLIRLMRIKKPDAVFTWMYHADLIGGVAYLVGIKNIIWGIRNTQIPQRGLSVTWFVIKLCSILSFVIPRVIVCCAYAAKSAHAKLGYCSKKMMVIPNGYDLTAFNPSQNLKNNVKKKLGIKEDSKVIGIVGRFDVLKDFNNFIQAASRVAQKFDNVYFLMAGKGIDQQNSQLMSWINVAKIEDRVLLFGQVDPHDIFAAMDFYCLSSKAEGFPNVVAEAMAMETPCIVTDVGDARIIVNDLGKVVLPNNPYQLSKAIIEMLEMPESLVIKMGSEARQFISDNYNIRKVAQQYLKLSHYGSNKR
jgi:glycosyltransferase involved in cell wall biosynthesis